MKYMQIIYKLYFNVINNKQYSGNEWEATKKIYSNPSGWMDGNSSYGITINDKGAGIYNNSWTYCNSKN